MSRADMPASGRKCYWCPKEAQTVYDGDPMCGNCAADFKAFHESRDELHDALFEAYSRWVGRWAGHLTFMVFPEEMLGIATDIDGNPFAEAVMEAFKTAGVSIKYERGKWSVVQEEAA